MLKGSALKLISSRSASAALMQTRMLARAIASMGVAVLLGVAVPAIGHALQALPW
jgi:hypothetical protein